MRDVPGDVAIMVTQGVQVKSLKMADDAPEYGDKVQIAGYPWGWKSPIYSVGIVMNPDFRPWPGDERYDRQYMLVSAQGAPGNSGSSVVNEDDEVIGVVQIGWNRTWSVMASATWEYLQKFKQYWSEK